MSNIFTSRFFRDMPVKYLDPSQGDAANPFMNVIVCFLLTGKPLSIGFRESFENIGQNLFGRAGPRKKDKEMLRKIKSIFFSLLEFTYRAVTTHLCNLVTEIFIYFPVRDHRPMTSTADRNFFRKLLNIFMMKPFNRGHDKY